MTGTKIQYPNRKTYVRRKSHSPSIHLNRASTSREIFMLQGRGRTFPTETIEKIRQLLAATDVSLAEMAERMNCSKSAVTSINSKYQVRVYENKRTRWTVKAADFPQKSLRNDESA